MFGHSVLDLESTFQDIILKYDFETLVLLPEGKKRREFVHDCWVIAQASENQEFMKSISLDPSFFITRDDLLQLLQMKDDKMITHLLKKDIFLNIREDVSYKLVKIKETEVD